MVSRLWSFHLLLVPKALIFWRELWGDFLQLCSMMFVLRFIVFLKSCVSCQALAEALQQNCTLTSLDLIGNIIGPEGAKACCLVTMGTRGILMYLACVGQILVEKRNNASPFYFQNRSPCHFQILGRATRFGMASQSYGFSGSWNGLSRGRLSQIVQGDHSGGRLGWCNMTSDRGYWSDAAPNHQTKYFHTHIYIYLNI